MCRERCAKHNDKLAERSKLLAERGNLLRALLAVSLILATALGLGALARTPINIQPAVRASTGQS